MLCHVRANELTHKPLSLPITQGGTSKKKKAWGGAILSGPGEAERHCPRAVTSDVLLLGELCFSTSSVGRNVTFVRAEMLKCERKEGRRSPGCGQHHIGGERQGGGVRDEDCGLCLEEN